MKLSLCHAHFLKKPFSSSLNVGMPILSVFDEAFDMHFKQKMKNEKIYLKLFSTFSVSHVKIFSSEID